MLVDPAKVGDKTAAAPRAVLIFLRREEAACRVFVGQRRGFGDDVGLFEFSAVFVLDGFVFRGESAWAFKNAVICFEGAGSCRFGARVARELAIVGGKYVIVLYEHLAEIGRSHIVLIFDSTA